MGLRVMSGGLGLCLEGNKAYVRFLRTSNLGAKKERLSTFN